VAASLSFLCPLLKSLGQNPRSRKRPKFCRPAKYSGRTLNVGFQQELPFAISHANDGYVPLLVVLTSSVWLGKAPAGSHY